ncbi:hypothetical protein EBB79_21990 (plasmid) [Parasedimentitalea marina]|uniref:Ferrochelatase n=1 Tax=Parasedimentitalea marina TaxID=2483033 RepID=A0A3T0N9A3_9RHOB|nr:hypothetical protein [Parasedimentitalea marina]AZV80634.1 hypothetical protein EBB79_21990 [Parasedimentitalea marina]
MKQIITAFFLAAVATSASAQVVEETPIFLGQTGLTVGTTAAVVTTVVVVGVIVNDDDESGTTTTTTTN